MKLAWKWIIIVIGIFDVISFIYTIRRGVGQTIDFLEGIKPWHDDLAIFLLVAVNVIVFVFKYDWFARKWTTFRLAFGFETPLERQEREQKIVQDEWRRKEDEKQAEWERKQKEQEKEERERESFISGLRSNSEAIVNLLQNKDNYYAYGRCEVITRANMLKLRKRGFNVPDELSVRDIEDPSQLPPEDLEFYKNWKRFVDRVWTYAEVGREEELKNSWYKEYDPEKRNES